MFYPNDHAPVHIHILKNKNIIIERWNEYFKH